MKNRFSAQEINFYYFSGTGNTLLVVQAMQKVFKKNGLNVTLHKIEETDPGKINTNGIVGLAFPVAMFSTYPLVWSFLKNLRQAQGCPAFVVDSLGGFSGGIMGPLKKLLLKKGYQPLAAKEIIMPPNIFYIYSDAENLKIRQKGLKKAQDFANNLIQHKVYWFRIPILSTLMSLTSIFFLWISQLKIHQQVFRFKVNKIKCTKCGLCIKACPVKNIYADPDNIPQFKLHCQYCLRCVGFCPTQAIPSRFNLHGKTYTAISNKKIEPSGNIVVL